MQSEGRDKDTHVTTNNHPIIQISNNYIIRLNRKYDKTKISSENRLRVEKVYRKKNRVHNSR